MKKVYLTVLVAAIAMSKSSAQNEGTSCADAIVLFPQGSTSCSQTQLNSSSWDLSTNGNPNGITPSCWGTNHNNVGWAQVTPTTTGTYTFDAICYTGSSKDVPMAVYTGSCGSLTAVAGGCEDAGASGPCPATNFTLTLTAGTTYYIAWSAPDGTSGLEGICIQGGTTPSAPANNSCGSATALTSNVPVSGTSVNATADLQLCSGSTENNVWYSYTPTTTGTYYFQLTNANCASDIGFQVSIYNAGENCGSIAGGTGECSTTGYSNTGTNDDFQITLNLTAGVTYYINIDGQSGTECTFNVEMSTTTLPVTYMYFYGKYEDDLATLNWATASETNAAYFVIERSFDTKTFAKIGEVPANGTTNVSHYYRFVDRDLKEGLAYYRLRQYDYNNDNKRSTMVSLRANLKAEDFNFFPNPASDALNIQFTSDKYASYELSFYNALGVLAAKYEVSISEGFNHRKVDVSALPQGVYSVVLDNGEEKVIKKVHVNKKGE
jgi:hypothetical protein